MDVDAQGVRGPASPLNGGPGRFVKTSGTRGRDLCADVQEWLFDAGWSLFFTGSTFYAMIRSDTVDGWVRLGSKRDQLAPELAC
jgi:hypothetical protein